MAVFYIGIGMGMGIGMGIMCDGWKVGDLYKNYNLFMVDKYGKRTLKKDKCEDIVIANF